MYGFKATGPSPSRSEFFKIMASAFVFMADFYTMSKEDQERLIQLQLELAARGVKK